MKSLLSFLAVIIGIAFFILAYMYWSTPAGALPTYIPGFAAGASTIHYKHGIASLLLGLASFAYAWFNSGR